MSSPDHAICAIHAEAVALMHAVNRRLLDVRLRIGGLPPRDRRLHGRPAVDDGVLRRLAPQEA